MEPVRGDDVAMVEVVNRALAESKQGRVNLAAKQVEYVLDSSLSIGGKTPEPSAANHHGFGSKGDCLDHIAASSDPAIEHDIYFRSNGVSYAT